MPKATGHRQSIYLSPTELETIERAAKKAGMSRGEYLKLAALAAAARGDKPQSAVTFAAP